MRFFNPIIITQRRFLHLTHLLHEGGRMTRHLLRMHIILFLLLFFAFIGAFIPYFSTDDASSAIDWAHDHPQVASYLFLIPISLGLIVFLFFVRRFLSLKFPRHFWKSLAILSSIPIAIVSIFFWFTSSGNPSRVMSTLLQSAGGLTLFSCVIMLVSIYFHNLIWPNYKGMKNEDIEQDQRDLNLPITGENGSNEQC